MYKRRDKNINFHVVHISQTKCSIKHISNIYGGVMQNEKIVSHIYYNYIIINMYLCSTGLEYLIG